MSQVDSSSPGQTDPPLYIWWLLWVAFVIYGSLVPLDFRPVAIDQAVARFLHVSLLQVGTAGRADWIANGVLYVPVGFLTTLLFAKSRSGPIVWIFACIGALLFSLSLAVGVEFAQVFFPPRTVSLNDLLAESIGSLVGVGLAVMGGSAFRHLLGVLSRSSRVSGGLLLASYALTYLAFALFPYDLLTSSEEIREKALSAQWGWLVADRPPGESIFVFASKLLAETLMAVPVGLLLGWRNGPTRLVPLARALLLASLFGLSLEALQFFIVSGVSQGLSAATRAAGFCIGVGIWNRRSSFNLQRARRMVRRLTLPLALLYLPLLPAIGGWFSSPWQSANAAWARLMHDVQFVPFYYHYYTTEAHALFSLASVALLYAPVGIVSWAWQLQLRHAFLIAAFLALLVEVGKLFAVATHPDPTNLVIAGFSALLAVKSMRFAFNHSVGEMPPHPTAYQQNAMPTVAMLVAVALLVSGWLAAFPTQGPLLGLFFALYAGVLWFYPTLLFAAIPAAIPLLDLAPWSGRFFLDEFDWLILISLVVGFARLPVARVKPASRKMLIGLAFLVGISFTISTVRALIPWPTLDVNAFNNYLSPFNALRIAKGAFWACLLLPLLLRAQGTGFDVGARFGAGMVVGLAGTVLFVLWERASFTELLDFAGQYRVTGPISAMHIGGAYIECFLTVATPFLLLQILRTQGCWLRLVGVGLLLGTTYALMVTFSRNGYAAYAVMFFVMLVAVARNWGSRRSTALITVALASVSIAVAWPILQGSFAQSRFSSVAQDLRVRQAHWSEALDMREPGGSTFLFGMGVGRFPSIWYWNSPENERSASYLLVRRGNNLALRIGAGRPIFVEQLIHIEPHRSYILQLDAKSVDVDTTATVQLCHKWQLESHDCAAQVFRLESGGQWQHFEHQIDSGVLGSDPWYASRPVKLTLQNSSRSPVDFDNIRLFDVDGRDLISNGDFANGLDHWNFTSDDHLAWHVKELPLAVFFDQGALGLLALGALTVAACWRSGRAVWRGSLAAGSVLAALCAFLIMGSFDTLIDAPRFLLLFLLLSWLALLRSPGAAIVPSAPAGP